MDPKDLKAWRPKLKTHGVIGGHDCLNPNSEGRATDEFPRLLLCIARIPPNARLVRL
jgi:hypothetical protein